MAAIFLVLSILLFQLNWNSFSFDRKDIVVSYSSEDIRSTSILLNEHPDIKNEIAAHIFFIPRISKEINEKLNLEEEKVSDATLYEPEFNDDSELASGEFIFLLDRSYSINSFIIYNLYLETTKNI